MILAGTTGARRIEIEIEIETGIETGARAGAGLSGLASPASSARTESIISITRICG